ncbi:amidase [Clostridium sp. Marseille-P2415]|uniref:amidase n=1 Tax=Clostridium sp. Marseille-P2415 TaxID=1805471 RepID=UPI0009884F38|nr:amidase [Clostridium sp. Marseille-P2415]
MEDITMLSMERVSKMIEYREISPVDLVEACIARTEKLQPELNAYVYFMADEAREAAKAAEKEIDKGHYKGKLHGIPIALKDLYYTRGIPTTASSNVLRDFRPEYNGTVVQRLIDAGAIIMGKTNTHEFAFGPSTEESCFGPTHNPWNPKKIPGGSSGGSAVAAATGMAYVAMGTDTGGSIRIPSHMSGTVGFKPSYGLVSLYGVIPMCTATDHPGPLCRSVADAAITVDAITGTDPLDPCQEPIMGESTHFYKKLREKTDLKGKVIGVPTNFFLEKTDFEVERVFKEGVGRFKALGAEIKYIEVPLLELLDDTGDCIVFSGTAFTHKDMFHKYRDKYQEGVVKRLEAGGKYTAVQYIQALKDRERLKQSWENVMKDLDAVVVPTCPIEAYDIGLPDPWLVQSRGKTEYGKQMCSRHTRLSSLTGSPALSLPIGLTKNNLPVGLMVMGRRNDDLGVLSVGAAYEKHYDYPRLKYGTV